MVYFLGIMGKKSERLSLIRRIISDKQVGSQEELIQFLEQYGVHATQSTLSRDFKEVNVSKVPHPEKGYVYVLADQMVSRVDVGISNLGDAILDVRFSANICVVITKPGYANAVGVVIDSLKSAELLGTVAGDNTIIIVLRDGVEHQSIKRLLCDTFPSLTLF